ncbi:MAG: hypothetical protein MK102_17690 [Fuerstiella sp.]|nr:hypothetical protein [Fuerstiella sp.]
MTIKIWKLSEYLGADVEGVDIASGVSPSAIEQLHAAFLEHSVLIFHDNESLEFQSDSCAGGI